MRWSLVISATNFSRRSLMTSLNVTKATQWKSAAYSYSYWSVTGCHKYPVKCELLSPPFTKHCICLRGYAKGKDKRKENKGKKKVEINENMLGEVVEVQTMKDQMQKAVDTLKNEYVKNLSLRSTTGSIESLKVNFEGKDFTLQELAQVIRKNPKTVIIDGSAFPQALPALLQSIKKSGMNLNPQQDGTTLFIPVPMVTKEYRETLAKNAKALFVKCRDNVKDVQNRYIKKVKNQRDLSEDTVHQAEEQIIALAAQYITEATKIYEAKEAELTG